MSRRILGLYGWDACTAQLSQTNQPTLTTLILRSTAPSLTQSRPWARRLFRHDRSLRSDRSLPCYYPATLPRHTTSLPPTQESLDVDFASMLKDVGLERMAADQLPSSNVNNYCANVTVADLDDSSQKALKEVYALDFSLLGYT